jgi:hypothetical protein
LGNLSHSFFHAVQSKGVWEHLDKPRPTNGSPEVLAMWDKDEAVALDLMTQRIPDSTVIHTMSLTYAAAMWADIVKEYMEKGTMVQTDLQADFLHSKCPNRGNVCQGGGPCRSWTHCQ